MSESWKDCEGQTIDGRFRLIQHLGGSNHSVVFLTERGQGQPQKAAIKFIQADSQTAEAQLARWKQAAKLSHANLIQLHEIGRCQLAGMDLLYVVMDHAQENLAEFIPQRPLAPSETRDMLEPLIDTLAYLHGQGYVHGRIEPGNILAIDDQLKLSSDSICRAGEPGSASEKPDAYTAPEIANGTLSPAGDVWALGMTLVVTLTQRVPERSGSEAPTIPESVAQPFLDIARHCLVVDPKGRWTVGEIAARLNPPAKPLAPAATLPAIPDPIKPAAPKPAPAVVPAPIATAAPKPASAVDPLSVPLSTVSPLAASRIALKDQKVPSGSPNRSYYLVVAVLVALTLGALLAIPRFRTAPNEPETSASSTPEQPNVQPEVSTSPAQVEPAPAPATSSKRDAKSRQQQSDSPARSGRTARNSADESAATAQTPAAMRVPVPAPAPAAPAAIATGPVTPGEVLNQVLPEVSDRSRSTIRGTVRIVIKAKVDASGSVSSAEIASGGSRFFGDAALRAARRWDFAPAKVSGQAVPSEWLLNFYFTQVNTTVTPLPTKP
jgi:TonB family protein